MNPLYHRAHYLISALHLKDAPPDEGFEVAFAGRSNAGKSSAINTITSHKTLARTSKTPGRTQLLNFFALDIKRRLVDLPGYGYAEVPEAMRRHWGKAMENYLKGRQCLRGVFLLMDIRHPLTEFDWQLIEWCRHCKLPLHIALTKADKLSRGMSMATLQKVRSELKRKLGEMECSVQLFSAPAKQGIEEAHALLDRWMGVAAEMTEEVAAPAETA